MLIARIGRHGQLGTHTSSVGLTHIEHYRVFSWMIFQMRISLSEVTESSSRVAMLNSS